jgi:hypothetical protein
MVKKKNVKKTNPLNTKASAKKSKSAIPGSMWQRVLIILAVIILGFVLFQIFGRVNDNSRFHWAEQRILYARSQMENIAGVSITSKWNNTCYSLTEFSIPNKLGCRVELDSKLIITGSQPDLLQKFNQLIRSDKVFGNSPASDGISIANKDLTCRLITDPTTSAVADTSQGQPPNQVLFNLECDGPVTHAVYPLNG